MTVTVEGLRESLRLLDLVVSNMNLGRGSTTAQYGHRMSSGSKEHPDLPISVEAFDRQREAWTYVLNLALRVAQTTRVRLPKWDGNETTANRVHGFTNYLYTHAATILTYTNAQQIQNELNEHTRRCENIKERLDPKVILGPCTTTGCNTQLEAREGETETNCPTCGYNYHITHHLKHRVTEALGHNGTPLRAAQAVRYLNSKGVNVTTKDVENWVKWGHLTEQDRDDKGRRLFNLQDIYTRAARNNA